MPQSAEVRTLRYRIVPVRAAVLSAIAVLLIGAPALAADPKVELLWPKGAPGAKGDKDSDKPNVAVYLPEADKGVGTAVIVCPGGGYGGLAMDHEGKQVAEWLNSLGVAAFVLTYRHHGTGYQHPAPMLDAQRAIRLVRAGAKTYKIKPDQIGILGFSAGGHLASTAETHFDKGKADAEDPIDRVSCRPDFAILVYPVISLTTSYTHQGSKTNLLGDKPDPDLVENLSNEKQVTPETPPTFLVHTNADNGVPPENSILFYMALRKANVPAELHIFQNGGHGLGLAPHEPGMSEWPKLCATWLRVRGLLTSESKKN